MGALGGCGLSPEIALFLEVVDLDKISVDKGSLIL